MENLNDSNFSGIGTLRGGKYRKVSVEGIATISGDIFASEVSVEGVCKGKGSITTEKISIEGVFSIDGSIKVSELTEVTGVAKIQGDIESREFNSTGSLSIKGLLSADRIDLNLVDKNYIKEIGGETINISVKRKDGITGIFRKSRLEVESIEGDNIRLHNVYCKSVRGRNIVVEEGCVIDTVECSGNLEIDNNASVRNIVRS